MSNPTSNFNWQMPTATDLVTDLPADFEVFGQAVDTALADLKGGTTGQVLAKASGTDMDFTWTAIDPLVILDAKGDLITATAADTPARLGVGSNGQVLTADSTASTGLKWATPAGGGKVLQVVSANTSTEVVILTTTQTDTGITATITPTAASSKILILISGNAYTAQASTTAQFAGGRLMRDATEIASYGAILGAQGATGTVGTGSMNAINYLDSPATTSAITYKLQSKVQSAGSVTWQGASDRASSITLLEIGV
jgi:hypothetical protein